MKRRLYRDALLGDARAGLPCPRPIQRLQNGDRSAIDAGASLVTNAAISIAKYATIEGQGTLDAGGGFDIIYAGSGTPSILAGTATSGGVLDVTGAFAYGVKVGFANAFYATTLKLEGTNSLKSIAISSAPKRWSWAHRRRSPSIRRSASPGAR